MPSLVYFIACTVDGFIADREGSTEFFAFEGPHVADLLAEFPEMIPGHLRGPLSITADNQRFDTVLMGRATHRVGEAVGVTSPYPHLRQIVVSASMTAPPDPSVEVIGSQISELVRALKAGTGKDIWLAGGARLAASLVDEIDEVILKINPIVLGAGIPLFADTVGPRPAALVGHRTYSNGFVLSRYRWER